MAPENFLPATAALRSELDAVGVEAFTGSDYKPGTVKHIVAFRFGPIVTAKQRADVRSRFLSLKTDCQRTRMDGTRFPYVVSIETGDQNSGEGSDQGVEQVYIVTFASEGDRNYYVGSPVVSDARYFETAHEQFKEIVGPLLIGGLVVVLDFSTQ